jgi:glycosyltransferase involved in cell wall biosynthesis
MSGLRILWLKSGPLHPLDTGGKLRTFNMLRELSREHRVTFLALVPEGTDPQHLLDGSQYSHEQIWIPWRDAPRRSLRGVVAAARNAVASSLPFSIEKYHSREMAQRLAAEDARGAHDLVVCDFLTPAVNFPREKMRTPTLLFEHNVESLIWRRLAENAGGVLARTYFRAQWQRMLRFEREACARCNGVVAVSDEDAAMLRDEVGLTNVLGSVPTGVDTEHFAAFPHEPEPRTLAFLGSMDWMPNIDAMIWFTAEIWPLIKARMPDVRLRIVGRRPPPQIEALARDPAIHVTGTVPDVRPELARSELMIVPLRVGGGTRIKIFEGMAAGLPVLSTRIGAEGLSITDGENIVLADAPESFADETVRLLTDSALRTRIAANGKRLVVENFSWASVTKAFGAHCQAVLA